jgi:methionine aminopeptidase
MVDRINKEIYAYDYEELSDRYKFEIDYHLIENMIIGNTPFAIKNSDKVSRQNNYFLVKQKSETHNVDNYIGRSTQKLEKLEIEQESTKNTLNLEYKDFNTVNNLLFPYSGSVSLKYNNNNKTLFTELSLEFSRAEIPDKPMKFPFNIPQKYARK